MFKLVRSGPGLVFMGFVVTMLIMALLGGLNSHSIKDDRSGPTYEAQLHHQEPKEMEAAGEDSDSMPQSRGAAPATAASEVLGKKEAVHEVANNAFIEGDFAVRREDYTPFLLALEGGDVLKNLGEELIHRHAITEFEKKFHN